MKMNIFFTIIVGLMISFPFYGQCDNKLIEEAMAQSGPEAIFVREFKAKLPQGTARNPLPSEKFIVYLKGNSIYRFNILNDKESDGAAILQLFKNGKYVAGTFDLASLTDKKSFDYLATGTGSFQVVISFREGKMGCAAGIMSLITVKAENNDTIITSKDNEELDVLYINVRNPVSIVTDKSLTDTLILEIDNGTIQKRAEDFFILPQTEGLATLKVMIKSREGKLKEEAKSDFLVRRLPAPTVTIHGMHGGIITRTVLQLSEGLEIDSPVEFEKYGYIITDFAVRSGASDARRLLNSGKKFSSALRIYLANIPEDTRLMIEDIHILSPEGSIMTLEPVGFIVR